jgi:ferritin-like metal-binding protein YciE
MPEQKTLHEAFVHEIRDIYDGERQITKALPKMIKKATSEELRSALEEHLEQTQGQIQRLEQVFASLDESVRGKRCEGVAGLVEEAKAIMEEDMDDAAMDAALIGAGQKVEHYEMATYGTLVAWARAMGHEEAAELLQQTLDEEKAADEKLNSIAEGGLNQEAADMAHPEEEEDEEEEEDDDTSSQSRRRTSSGRSAKVASGRR